MPSRSNASITNAVVSGHRRYSGLFPVPARSATLSKVSRPNPTSASSATTASAIACWTSAAPRRVRTDRAVAAIPALVPRFGIARAYVKRSPGLFGEHGGVHRPESGHLDPHGVAGHEPLRWRHPHCGARGGTGRDDVARLQCGGGAQPLDELVRVGGHLLRRGVLSRFVVDPGLDPDVLEAACFVGGDQPGPGREERVP